MTSKESLVSTGSAPSNHIHSSATKYQYKPEWYFENGLRKVKPYLFQFSSFAKERWRGRSVIDIFSTDFRDRSPDYYAHAVASGVIKVNGKSVTGDRIIKNGDRITNVLHRHEPPVAGDPVRILHRDDVRGLLVVEKPGSMPVHPTGRYNYNTMLSILRFDYDLPLVHTSNRLDRLTSGVMVCALTVEASKTLSTYFSTEGAVKKEYIARCRGQFPEEEITCEEPLLTIDRQIGLNVVHPEGKHAKTIFKKINYDPTTDSSVVHCRPITGRSHQIRVHLQFLGFPILNDTIYSDIKAWGPAGGKGGIFTDSNPTIHSVLSTNESPKKKNLPTSDQEEESKKESNDKQQKDEAAKEESEQAELGKGIVPAQVDVCKEDCPGIDVGLCSHETDESKLTPPQKRSASTKIGRNQRQGLGDVNEKRVRLDPETAESGNSSKITINELASAVILELRKSRDIEDDFGRKKDTMFIDRAFDLKTYETKEEESKLKIIQDRFGTFCGDCGLPLLPDPKPEQLYIYLHALRSGFIVRYQTDSWDFSSDLPWWAKEEEWGFRKN